MKTILTLLLCLMFSAALAQPGSNDPTFNPGDSGFGNGDGFDKAVYGMAIESDGKIIAAGEFTLFNAVPRKSVARLHADGSLDISFNPAAGCNGPAYSVALQSDGKIVIGGAFTTFDGVPRNRIARLNADGSLDATFNPGSGANGEIYAVCLQSDGKILVGGVFSFFNGTSCSNIARLNADGTIDATFNSGAGADGAINSIVLQPDGKIVLGGHFSFVYGASRNRIARLNTNGSLDSSFNPGTGFTSSVRSFTLRPDGKMIVVGNFTHFNGTLRGSIVQLNSDGSLDASFNPQAGYDTSFVSVALQPDGKVVAGGAIVSSTSIRPYVTRLHPDGSRDISFNPQTEFKGEITCIALQPDEKILMSSRLASNGVIHSYTARLNANGMFDDDFNPGKGFDGDVRSIALQPDGKVLAWGTFTFFNGVLRRGMARLNGDGSLDATFDCGAGFSGPIRSVSLQPDGKIVVGGSFSFFNGILRKGIARLNADGSLDNSFNVDANFEGSVRFIALQPDGKILAARIISSVGGSQRILSRLNADGSTDASFHSGTGLNSDINSIIIQPNGKIVVAGTFSIYNGIQQNSIARLHADGSLDVAFDSGTGAAGEVRHISLQADGKILVAGGFGTFNEVPRQHIARLNADGSLDYTFDPGTGFYGGGVNTLALQPDGKIVAAGSFTSFNGIVRNRIVRLNADGSLDTIFDPGAGFSGFAVNSLALQPDGNIIAGGAFTSYNGIGRNRIARLIGGGTDGIEDSGFATAIKAYPNPADDRVLIELGDVYPGVLVAVRNLAGQLLFVHEAGLTCTCELNLSNLPDGMYLLEVSTCTGEQVVLKVLKE